jgi:tripartite-type tricarboxylate transporter receptor subunit TctC
MLTHGLAVGPMVPASVKSVKDYLAWAKANPKDANYGSPAAGSTPHFLGALLGLESGVDLKHVPYRGSIPGITDVIGGQLASMVTPHGDFLPNHRAGKLRIIATSGKARSPFVPEVPTFAEQGFPDLVVEEWFGFYAPAKTPATVITNANTAINAALKEKSVIDSLALSGMVPLGGSPEDMAKSMQYYFEFWGPLVKKIGFTAES